jgi:hypothetical protein
VASKEDAMLDLLVRFLPHHVVHDLGGGRAVDNARGERDEVARTSAIVDDLAGRLPSVPGRTAAAATAAA